jgi:2-phosphosulfolactate phosphatase
LHELASSSETIVIVDVLSFTTSVEIATDRGAIVFPYPFNDRSAAGYARTVNAELASSDRTAGFSLSPTSLQRLPSGDRLVLPSPNGAALCFAASHRRVFAAYLSIRAEIT